MDQHDAAPHARGLICVPLTGGHLERLGLSEMTK
jgi:3,4-dihydroxy-2-butanone 4-phosphate synthase